MHSPGKVLLAVCMDVGFLAPLSASAAASPFIYFGGRVVSINYCLHGAVNIIIRPAGAFPISYVWGLPPTTITVSHPYIPPSHITQQVLGLAVPVVIPCVGFGTHPPVWYGFHVLWGGVSLVPPTSVGEGAVLNGHGLY